MIRRKNCLLAASDWDTRFCLSKSRAAAFKLTCFSFKGWCTQQCKKQKSWPVYISFWLLMRHTIDVLVFNSLLEKWGTGPVLWQTNNCMYFICTCLVVVRNSSKQANSRERLLQNWSEIWRGAHMFSSTSKQVPSYECSYRSNGSICSYWKKVVHC